MSDTVYETIPKRYNAIQWTGDNVGDVRAFIERNIDKVPPQGVHVWDDGRPNRPSLQLMVTTATGEQIEAAEGEWITVETGEKRWFNTVDDFDFQKTIRPEGAS